jgi:hypothetical protein
MVIVAASACAKTPTQPSISLSTAAPAATSAVTLSNLTGRSVGVADHICGDGSAQPPIDDLTLDFQVSAGSVAGALLVACDTSECESGTPLGTVVDCPVPPDPCSAGLAETLEHAATPACFTGDPSSSGTIHILAPHAADASGLTVTAYMRDSDGRSNTVTAVIDQPL